MKTIETKAYLYDELSEEAQEKARDWFREGNCDDTFWSECVTDDFKTVAKACGFTLSKARGLHSALAIYWEGFSHQGSGASFEGSWRASDVNVAQLLKDWPATYADEKGETRTSEHNAELHPILEGFAKLASQEPTGYGSVSASHRGHSLTCEYDHENEDDTDLTGDPVDTFKELCSDLAHWLYRTLEREYEYQNSDETVTENIRANEYTFTADGERFG